MNYIFLKINYQQIIRQMNINAYFKYMTIATLIYMQTVVDFIKIFFSKYLT